jgi:hypothetical protein
MWGGVSPLGTSAAISFIIKAPGDRYNDECRTAGGMRIGNGIDVLEKKKSTARPGLESGPPRWDASD